MALAAMECKRYNACTASTLPEARTAVVSVCACRSVRICNFCWLQAINCTNYRPIQHASYHHCYQQNKDRTDWFLIVDVDEVSTVRSGDRGVKDVQC